jgi:hypothetical protein
MSDLSKVTVEETCESKITVLWTSLLLPIICDKCKTKQKQKLHLSLLQYFSDKTFKSIFFQVWHSIFDTCLLSQFGTIFSPTFLSFSTDKNKRKSTAFDWISAAGYHFFIESKKDFSALIFRSVIWLACWLADALNFFFAFLTVGLLARLAYPLLWRLFSSSSQNKYVSFSSHFILHLVSNLFLH